MSSASKKISPKKSFVDLLQSNNYKKQNQQKQTSKGNSKSRCKSGATKAKKQKDQMKSLLKESYLFLKEDNESLHQKLSKKGRKIEELKEKIKQYETKLSVCQQALNNFKHNASNKPIFLETDQTLKSSRKKYEQMIRQSQQVAKQSIQKYKKLQKQMEEQKAAYEQQIMILKKGNDTYRQIIESFKFSQRSLNTSASKKKSNSIHKVRNDTETYSQMKQLSILKKRQEEWVRKEQEMKNMLRQLANKLTSFQSSLRMSDQKVKTYKMQLSSLQEKYSVKCRKQKENIQKWANIFKQLIKQMQGVGKDIESTKKLFVTILKNQLALHERD